MSEELHTITWYAGVDELPKSVVKVRPGEVEATYRLAGIEVIVTDDLPPGVMGIMGYRNKDGSFREGAVRLVND